MPAKWYAVHTIAGHEQKVDRMLTKLAQKEGLWDRDIFQVLIPMEDSLSNRNGKRVVVPRKVFPGYIMVKMNLTEESYRLVKRTSGVTGFVSSGQKPIPMDDWEIEGIMTRIDASRESPQIPYVRGDNVRVVDGPFADFPGKVEEVVSDKQKLKVMLTIFGRDTPVELDFTQVEKV